MTYIEAPAEYEGIGESLFLAGGISGTHDWQTELVSRLADLPIALLNPRRRNFPMNDPNAAEGQIAWEFRHLRLATAVVFWFPPETLCPIALFELGGRIAEPKQALFVGTHADYRRRIDVQIQLKLARPSVALLSDIPSLANEVRAWAVRSSA
jgi:hypothetical protein